MQAYPPIAELLPHAGPAVLLDAVLEQRADSLRARLRITPANPYFEPGRGVPVWVGIELMAQAVAAHAGLIARRSQNPPKKGMLLGTRRYEASVGWFAEGSELDVEARREFGEDESGVAACVCSITSDGKELARATLIIVQVDDKDMPKP
ncbi:MAG TPA: 3-hydroxylacyl-ACP dehydratase [Gammaproteobacteria bacterium]|jgi:predicted hotdog family 3-hydroxylacyl-ACP dehydratase